MAGYKGYSMSNNAVVAYERGEKPFSKWSKKDILEEIRKNIDLEKYDFKKISSRKNIDLEKYDFKKISSSILKNYFLQKSSWHHTSSYYNCTNFYRINYNRIESFDINRYNKLVDLTSDEKMENNKDKKSDEHFIAYIKYTEWEGSRKYPKAVEKEEFVYCVNNKAYTSLYNYKLLTGKSIVIIRKYKDLRGVPNEERQRLSHIRKKYKK